MAERQHEHEQDGDLDRGLAFDLPNLLGRRRALTLLGGAGLAVLVGCGSSDKAASSAASTSSSTTASPSSRPTTTSSGSTSTASSTAAAPTCVPIPEETAGPYPGDGSNGPNVLDDSGVVRRDIRSSFGSSTTRAEGEPLTVKLQLQDASTCTALAGGAVYVWHCDREGRYSMYSPGVINENYLRGVQEVAADGTVTFLTTFPGCYSGRWPHIHFEVHPSLADATRSGTPLATSQIALPKDVCDQVYATTGYGQSVTNVAKTSLQGDMIFADSYQQETGTMTGTLGGSLTVTLAVPVPGYSNSKL